MKIIIAIYGTGELIRDALEKRMHPFHSRHLRKRHQRRRHRDATSLRFRYLDNTGKVLRQGGEILKSIDSIDISLIHPRLKSARFTVACDAHNPFYGPEGAAQVLARQKGADEDLLMQAGFQNIHTTKPKHITLAEAMQKETAKQHIQSTIKRFLA